MFKNTKRKIRIKLSIFNLALFFFYNTLKLGGDKMFLSLYEFIALQIVNDLKTIEQVPAKQRPMVQAELDKLTGSAQ